MPWKVSGKKVIKSDTGKVVKVHNSEADAKRHVKALYANYKSKPTSTPVPPGIRTVGGSPEGATNPPRKPEERPRLTKQGKKRKIT